MLIVIHVLCTEQILAIFDPTTVTMARMIGRDLHVDVDCQPCVVYWTDSDYLLSNNSVIVAVIARMIGRDLDVDIHPCVVYWTDTGYFWSNNSDSSTMW